MATQKVQEVLVELRVKPPQKLINDANKELESILNACRVCGISPLKDVKVFRRFQECLLTLAKVDSVKSNINLTKGLMVFLGFFVQERLRFVRNQHEILSNHIQGNQFYKSRIHQMEKLILNATTQTHELNKKINFFQDSSEVNELVKALEQIQALSKGINSVIEELDANLRALIEIYKKQNNYHKGLQRVYDSLCLYSNSIGLVWVGADLLINRKVFNHTKLKVALGTFALYSHLSGVVHSSKTQQYNQNVKDFRANWTRQDMHNHKNEILDSHLNFLVFQQPQPKL